MQPESEERKPIPWPQTMALERKERVEGQRRPIKVPHVFMISQDPMFVKADDWIDVRWDLGGEA